MALLFQRTFSDDFVLELRTLAVDIFGDMDTDELAWRLSAMPDASVHATRLEGRIVAFKFGYAIERKRYLSWLGGVSRGRRRQRLARDLMARQHDWLRTRGPPNGNPPRWNSPATFFGSSTPIRRRGGSMSHA